mmetsp:Transcript_37345/g.111881  ORF Transcript_37345/g.111881 Transcript_37345/m.111881 type:complete len:86 (+) Transcript_37345:3808-4065(+)
MENSGLLGYEYSTALSVLSMRKAAGQESANKFMEKYHHTFSRDAAPRRPASYPRGSKAGEDHSSKGINTDSSKNIIICSMNSTET